LAFGGFHRHLKCASSKLAMTDTISKERRSWNMGRISGKDTGPEKRVRSLLHRLGYRFRLHDKALPGRPDIVLRQYRTVIFVHGCFWHRHRGCRYAYSPKSRVEFWEEKFAQNILRDQDAQAALVHAGWRVAIMWECETRDLAALAERVRKLLVKPGTSGRSR
jgi:DNA mismatch endonuclease, patch repair protein